MVQFVMLYEVVLNRFESVNETLKCDFSNGKTQQSFPVVLFITLYRTR